MLRLFSIGSRGTQVEGRADRKDGAHKVGRRARPALEPLEGRKLMTISPLSPNAGFPFTTGVELQITYPDGKHFVGSGVMVDSYHVLTAGHVIYDASQGGFATSIIATPELNGTSGRFGTASMTHETTYNTWINYSKAHPGLTAPGDLDIGLFSLNKNIGNSTGWMSYGYDNNNGRFSSGTTLNTFGYPAAGGYNGTVEEFSTGTIAGLSSDGSAIDYYQGQITTFGGSSGSPLYLYNSSTGARTVYGIVVGGNGTPTSLNYATRITQSIYNDVGSWIGADNAVRHPVASMIAAPTTSTREFTGTAQVLVPMTTTPAETAVVFGMDVPHAKTAKAFRFAS